MLHDFISFSKQSSNLILETPNIRPVLVATMFLEHMYQLCPLNDTY